MGTRLKQRGVNSQRQGSRVCLGEADRFQQLAAIGVADCEYVIGAPSVAAPSHAEVQALTLRLVPQMRRRHAKIVKHESRSRSREERQILKQVVILSVDSEDDVRL